VRHATRPREHRTDVKAKDLKQSSVDISVVTPVFNADRFIDETVVSVIDQSGVDWEYIIVDDGSTDHSAQVILDRIHRSSGTIRFIRQENQGEANAVNVGVSYASGRYLCIVSADDPLLPGHLSKMVKALDKNDDCVVAYPDWIAIDENGAEIRRVNTLEFDDRALVVDFVCLPGPGSVIRRSALSLQSLRDNRYRFVSDYEAWLRISLRGQFLRVPEYLASYRIHASQATATGRGEAMAKEIENVVANFYQRPDVPSHLLKHKRRAHGIASYYAGLQRLHDSSVKGRKRMLKSLILAPPRPVSWKTHRRSVAAILLVLTMPLTNPAYSIASAVRRRLR
jgi:glycosyltransferase involved in cell wall biosynthesis